MEFLQGYFATVLWALVFSCIIAKLVSSAVSSDEKKSKVVAVGDRLAVERAEGEERMEFVGDGLVRGVHQVEIKGVREINAESSDIAKMVDEDEGEVLVETVEQCCDARESKNIGLSEVGASKIDALCGVEGKDVLGDVKVVGEELKTEEVGKKNVVESNLPRDDAAASGYIEGDRTRVGTEGGLRVRDEDVSDDDWEGIERSELEILFAKAINFVECGNNDALPNLGNELQMQLYALQKMAMEGSCYEPQPMAFKVSARAKWNAWQGMGSMSSEVAMEQYIKLLSDNIPTWIRCSSTESCVNSSSAIGKNGDPDFDPSSPDIQSDCTGAK